jgi:thiamine-monophosphate kinase
MIDLSDGLALDLARLCGAGGVGARIRLSDVPVAPALRRLAGVLDLDPLDLALHGGEDYELLAAVPASAVDGARAHLDERYGTALTEIGEITAEGLVAVGEDGSESPLEPRGWDHFVDG